jgi:excisionase family DNA binding protein
MTERLLTARELADLLGLSTGTVLDRFEAGDLPGFRLYGGRVGAPVRFRWSEVDAMLETGRCGPAPSQRPEIAVGSVHA